jgi:hypothetical protein
VTPANAIDVLDAVAHLPGIGNGFLQAEHRARHLVWRLRDLEGRRRRIEATIAEVNAAALRTWADLATSGQWSDAELLAALPPGEAS